MKINSMIEGCFSLFPQVESLSEQSFFQGLVTSRGRGHAPSESEHPLEWVSLIRQGFPTQALDSLGTNIKATIAELAQLLGISVRMLAQRRRKGILSQQESERLFRVAGALAKAEEVFSDLGRAFHWLNSSITVLRGATPLSLLDAGTALHIRCRHRR